MFDSGFLQQAILAGPVIIFSLTVHEFFHAWSANRFGDPTAKNLGRLTLNPLKHLELFGVIVMVMSGFRFGWAKPVPVNPMNLRNPRVADLWISAAGPLSNFGLAIIASIILRLTAGMSIALPDAAGTLLYYFVVINLTLAFFNLIPLFPLDGSHILRSLLPQEQAAAMERMNRIAPFILIILLVTGALSYIIWPPVTFFAGLLLS